ncbi:hypothetical protein [Curtobacterium sp. VKM Ac-1376]|uniref:hypothetical protein n=1 Tax=Curtobacterium sp. VKM Ac-1376 TaxID=123312 RepID=UPI00188A8A65|nr:hypothetical protein [Curtobacterium sp. VKM Ac-1376]MBF4616217.1 hypothetical protein [Curtobacterium sp. VKM Ac-1376]
MSILNGATPMAHDVPAAQETLLAALPNVATAAPPEPGEDSTGGTNGTAAYLRPFDGTPPLVESGALSVDDTCALVERARAEGCTVQSALGAAAARALFEATGQDQVRINIPIDLRPVVGGDTDVVVRFTATMVTLQNQTTDFWNLARTTTAQLRTARHAAAAGAAALAAADVPTPDAAEDAMLAATAADIEITNLGTTEQAPSAKSVWGPTMTTGVAGEQILGVVTHAGALRMVSTTRTPSSGLTHQIQAQLSTALH